METLLPARPVWGKYVPGLSKRGISDVSKNAEFLMLKHFLYFFILRGYTIFFSKSRESLRGLGEIAGFFQTVPGPQIS
jgi:hypothetical protein